MRGDKSSGAEQEGGKRGDISVGWDVEDEEEGCAVVMRAALCERDGLEGVEKVPFGVGERDHGGNCGRGVQGEAVLVTFGDL